MQLEKFVFRIRTRNGATLDHLTIQAASDDDARSRLMRMYPHCEILAGWTESSSPSNPSKSFEDLADLLNQ